MGVHHVRPCTQPSVPADLVPAAKGPSVFWGARAPSDSRTTLMYGIVGGAGGLGAGHAMVSWHSRCEAHMARFVMFSCTHITPYEHHGGQLYGMARRRGWP